jgi:hypothetical protein
MCGFVLSLSHTKHFATRAQLLYMPSQNFAAILKIYETAVAELTDIQGQRQGGRGV